MDTHKKKLPSRANTHTHVANNTPDDFICAERKQWFYVHCTGKLNSDEDFESGTGLDFLWLCLNCNQTLLTKTVKTSHNDGIKSGLFMLVSVVTVTAEPQDLDMFQLALLHL